MIKFRMPSLGADMEAATLIEWAKRPGERVARGELLAVVETQKGAIEIESFHAGVLDRILVQPGERAPVGQVLALIRDESEAPSAPPTAAMPASVAARPAFAIPPSAVEAPPPQPAPSPASPLQTVRVRITPAARRLAETERIDLASLVPGPDGTIGLAEVERARAARPIAQDTAKKVSANRALPSSGIDFGEMRKAIAAAMARSNREIPHYAVSSTFDASVLLAWLERTNATRAVPERLLYAVPLLKAVALALQATPELNGHFVDGRFVPSASVHMGVAVALRGGGLIAPAIHDVDKLGLDALMARLDDLVRRVRGGRLRSSELSDGTITLSNLGENSADAITPLIYPPQVAIVGCGQIAQRPRAVDGAVLVRPLITIAVAGDHRVSDGRSAAKFLLRLGQLLQKPEML